MFCRFEDAPSAPGASHAQEVGSNFVVLNWTKPASDGGGPISGYWIEKKEKSSDKWIRCNNSPLQTTSFNVQNLVEDAEYEFRIFAENDAGLSPPGQTQAIKVGTVCRFILIAIRHYFGSFVFKIRDPNAAQAPEFVRRLADGDVIESRSARFECEIKGSPTPSVQWYKGGQAIYDNLKYTMSSDGDKYTLVVNNVSIDDHDEYSVKASNLAGQKSSRANLVVRCECVCISPFAEPKLKLVS